MLRHGHPGLDLNDHGVMLAIAVFRFSGSLVVFKAPSC